MTTQLLLQINNRQPFAKGKAFGDTGSYECISGTVSFSISPEDQDNTSIVDLNLVQTNPKGFVKFSTDFYILKPLHLSLGNGTLIYDVNNRGNKRLLQFMNDAPHSNKPISSSHAGNGFLMERGYSIIWSGWQGDLKPGDNRLTMDLPVPTVGNQDVTGMVRSEFVVDQQGIFSLPLSGNSYTKSYRAISTDTSKASLTYREYEHEKRIPISPSQWKFAYLNRNGVKVSSHENCHLQSGFQPGLIYELLYPAKKPLVLGLGFLGVRDLISFFRYEKVDAAGITNPFCDDDIGIQRAYSWGRSQSGRFLREFVYQGYNEAPNRKKVFDAVFPHVAGGGRVSLNYRFAQPGRFPLNHAEHLYPSDQFPFAYSTLTDPFTKKKDGILKRPKTDPLVIHTQTASEYWDRRGSLVHTDLQGKDLPEHDKVRVFLFASSQHFADPLQSKQDALLAQITGSTRYPPNPLNTTPVLRALLDKLDQWVRNGTPPPPSQVPSVADGTAVKAIDVKKRFPLIPGLNCSFACNRVYFQDHGDQFSKGILNQEPPIEHLDKEYPIYVSQVDHDGNEISGIRTPHVEVPLATYTGWNMRPNGYAENAPTGTTGSYFPFTLLKESRLENKDPRLSIQERFSSRADYVIAIRKTATNLRKAGFLLQEDIDQYVIQAKTEDIFDKL